MALQNFFGELCKIEGPFSVFYRGWGGLFTRTGSPRPMPPHDRLFKTLLRTFFADLVRLAAPTLAQKLCLGRAVFLDKELLEISLGRREADLLAKVPLRGGGWLLIHAEIEARARKIMPRRLRGYARRIQARYDGQLLSILLNLRGGTPGIRQACLDGELSDPELSTFRYVSFGLAGCPAADFLERPEPLAWGLAALMDPGPLSRPEHKLACLRRIAAARLKDDQRILLKDFVEAYLELTPEESKRYKELVPRKRGGEKGKDMWMTWSERNEMQGMRQVLLHQLDQKFGPLPEKVQEKLQAISTPKRLTRLAEKILTARSLRELGFR